MDIVCTLSSKCNKVIHTDKERIDIVVMKIKGERNDESPWESLHVVVVYIQNSTHKMHAHVNMYGRRRSECVWKRASRVVYFAGLLATRRGPAFRIMQLN